MDSSFTITFKGDYIEVISRGKKDLEHATKMWTAVAAACRENNCFNVLGFGESTDPIGPVVAYDHADLFRELGIYGKFRIAWVERNPKAKDAVRFAETVLFNRGLPGKVFDDEEEAREWLVAALNSRS